MKRKKIWIVLLLVSVLLGSASLVLMFSTCYAAYGTLSSKPNEIGLDISTAGLPEWVTPEILLTSLELQEQYGIYASVTIAQAQQEVGGTWNGTSLYPTASVDYNLFGLKATGSGNTWNGEVTWDGRKGGTGTYRKYTSYSQGLKDRARLLLTGSVYSNVAATVFRSSREQLQALSESPWCENQYQTLEGFMNQFNLWRLDDMTVDSINNGTEFPFTDAEAKDIQKKIVDIAKNNKGTRPCTLNFCAAWVSGVYEAAGLGYPGGNAIDYWNRWSYSGSKRKDNIPVGAAVLSSGSGSEGAKYGHIGIYLGNGMVANNIGYLSIVSVDQFANQGTATCQGYKGWIGWVYPYGKSF